MHQHKHQESPMALLKEFRKEQLHKSFLNSSHDQSRTHDYGDLTMNSDERKSPEQTSNCTSELSKSETPENL